MTSRLVLATAFFKAATAPRRFRTRAALEALQAKQVGRLLTHARARTSFYADVTGRTLADLPIVTKPVVQDAFAAFNTLGIDAARAWSALENAGLPGYELGASTGTQGQRGLYIVSDAERFRWLGTILGKALPDVLWRRHRVAILLPPARLYQSADQSRLLQLLVLDPRSGPEACRPALEAFDPTVIVAAPKTLRALAESGARLRPRRIYAAGEILDAIDRRIIERRYCAPLGRIYMASEGLLGVTCRHGRLHLAEDVVHFELQPVGDDPGLVTPIVTDLVRRTQIIARYRIGDLLRVDPAPCPCGCPFAVVDVVGRHDDLFRLRAIAGGPAVALVADRLTATILSAERTIDDFRLHRLSEERILLVLHDAVDAASAETARAALERMCRENGADVVVALERQPLAPPFDRKLRRVVAQPPESA